MWLEKRKGYLSDTSGEIQNIFSVTSVTGSVPVKGFLMETVAEDTWLIAVLSTHFTPIYSSDYKIPFNQKFSRGIVNVISENIKHLKKGEVTVAMQCLCPHQLF